MQRKILLGCALLAIGTFFACFRWAWATSPYTGLRINEIQTASVVSTKDEFVELYNASGKEIALKECALKRHTKGKTTYDETLVSKGKLPASIGAGAYAVIANPAGSVDAPDGVFSGSTYTITADNSVAIMCADGDVSEATVSGEVKGASWSYDDADNVWRWSSTPTPKKRNAFPVLSGAKTLRLNEVFPDPKEMSDAEGEFVEVYNFGSEDIALSGWSVRDASGEKGLSETIGAGKYAAFMHTVSLNNGGETLALVAPDGTVIDSVSYGEAKEGWSWAFDGATWRWTPRVTQGKENLFPEPASGSSYIRLNEVLPNPDGSEEGEFVELYNASARDADISFWTVRDKSGNSYTFPDGTKMVAGAFLVLSRTMSGLSLNNTDETVELLDATGLIVNAMSYKTSKEGVSWGFDGMRWRACLVSTPGSVNQLNGEPQSNEVTVPEEGYVDVWVYFSADGSDADGDTLKYRWDFGDGHASYKQNTKHRYTEEGKYTVTLRIDDGREPREETYTIDIESYPHRKMRIVAMEPNPEGKDAEREWIRVKNESGKTVDLNGWSVATGKDAKRLSNHPIKTNIKIKKGKETIITHVEAKITLNNKKGVVELRYPDGERADRVKYEQKDGIGEGDVYRKEKKKGWVWDIAKEKARENVVEVVAIEAASDTDVFMDPVSDETVGDGQKTSRVRARLGREYAFGFPKGSSERVAGVFSVRLGLDGDRYVFVEGRASEYWLVSWWRNLKAQWKSF